jgi:predicted esterase
VRDDDVDDLEIIEDSDVVNDGGHSNDREAGSWLGTLLLRGIKTLIWGVVLCMFGVAGLLVLNAIVKSYKHSEAPIDVANFKPGDPLPEPPLQLTEPPVPASRIEETNLVEIDSGVLQSWAQQFMAKGNARLAIQCQHMAVVKADHGRYNLACYYSRAGDAPAALYWLQKGAQDEGADSVLANRDGDFANLRQDPRWPALMGYLRVYQRYWETSGISEISLVVPRGSTGENPIPLFIGLHGVGADARGFVDPKAYQPMADAMGVAFLAVSGTNCRGKHSFAWSEDPAQDLTRIDAAIREVADRVKPAAGQIALFGFSQGAWLSAELALRYPDRFAGAIILSPGNLAGKAVVSSGANPAHHRQGIIAVCGAGEHAGTIECTKQCATAFEKSGARVYKRFYLDMNMHTFPPDYWETFPIWGKFILDPTGVAPAQ